MAESKSDQIAKLELTMEQVTRTGSLLNQNQVQKLFNSTPKNSRYKRPAKGGGEWDYVKTSYVRKVLDSVFGFSWSFEVETSVAEAFEVAKLTGAVVVKGTIVAKVYKDKEWVELRKTQFGRADVKWQMVAKTGTDGKVMYANGKIIKVRKIDEYTNSPVPLDLGNDFKAATSDALKKCASLFGIAADVYEASEFQEIAIIGSDQNSDRKKATEKALKEAKGVLEAESTVVEDTKK
jgi:hypothetical protein